MSQVEKVVSALPVQLWDGLPAHHKAWLGVHPHRDVKWFVERIREGFDIHHLDGNHDNNDPSNLVMIEHTDHLALHNNGTLTLGRLSTKGKTYKGRRSATKKRARKVYEAAKRQNDMNCG